MWPSFSMVPTFPQRDAEMKAMTGSANTGKTFCKTKAYFLGSKSSLISHLSSNDSHISLGEKISPTSEEPSHWVKQTQHLWRNLLKRSRLEIFWCFSLLILKSEPGASCRILRMLHSLQDLKLWRTLNQGVYCYIRTPLPPHLPKLSASMHLMPLSNREV